MLFGGGTSSPIVQLSGAAHIKVQQNIVNAMHVRINLQLRCSSALTWVVIDDLEFHAHLVLPLWDRACPQYSSSRHGCDDYRDRVVAHLCCLTSTTDWARWNCMPLPPFPLAPIQPKHRYSTLEHATYTARCKRHEAHVCLAYATARKKHRRSPTPTDRRQ